MTVPHDDNLGEFCERTTAPIGFGAGLSEAEVRRLQMILREQCSLDLALPEAWSRAIELLSLVEMLLQSSGALTRGDEQSAGFALPRS